MAKRKWWKYKKENKAKTIEWTISGDGGMYTIDWTTALVDSDMPVTISVPDLGVATGPRTITRTLQQEPIHILGNTTPIDYVGGNVTSSLSSSFMIHEEDLRAGDVRDIIESRLPAGAALTNYNTEMNNGLATVHYEALLQ